MQHELLCVMIIRNMKFEKEKKKEENDTERAVRNGAIVASLPASTTQRRGWFAFLSAYPTAYIRAKQLAQRQPPYCEGFPDVGRSPPDLVSHGSR